MSGLGPHFRPTPPPLLCILLQFRLHFCHSWRCPLALEVNALLLPPPPIVCPLHLLPPLSEHSPRPTIPRPVFSEREEVRYHFLQARFYHRHCYLLLAMDPLWISYTMNHRWPPAATQKITTFSPCGWLALAWKWVRFVVEEDGTPPSPLVPSWSLDHEDAVTFRRVRLYPVGDLGFLELYVLDLMAVSLSPPVSLPPLLLFPPVPRHLCYKWGGVPFWLQILPPLLWPALSLLSCPSAPPSTPMPNGPRAAVLFLSSSPPLQRNYLWIGSLYLHYTPWIRSVYSCCRKWYSRDHAQWSFLNYLKW